MSIGIGFKGLEEGRRGVYEEHALPPACRHRGRDREGKGEGEKRVEGERVLGRVGRVSAGAIPSLSLPFGATLDRRASQSLHISLSYVHSNTVIPPYTVLSATTLRVADGSNRGLIIKYFLDNRITAPRLSSGP